MSKSHQSIGMCRTSDLTSSSNAAPAFQQPMGNAAMQQNIPRISADRRNTSSPGPISEDPFFKAGRSVAPANNVARMSNVVRSSQPGSGIGQAAAPFAFGFGGYNAVDGASKIYDGTQAWEKNGGGTDDMSMGGMQMTGGLTGLIAGAKGLGIASETAFMGSSQPHLAAALGTGLALGTASNSVSEEYGLAGQGKDGKNRSYSDKIGDEAYQTYEDAKVAGFGEFGATGLAAAQGLGNAVCHAPAAALTGAFGLASDIGGLLLGD